MLSHPLRRMVIVALAGLVLSTLPPGQATAALSPSAAAGPMGGSGQISPDLDLSSIGPHVFVVYGTFEATGTVSSSVVVMAQVPVLITGTDLLGSYAEGLGSVHLVFDGLGDTWGVFVRVGAVTTIEAAFQGAPTAMAVHASCIWLPVNLPPTPSSYFSLNCMVALANAS